MNLAVDHPAWLLLSLIGIVSAVFGWRAMRGIPRLRRSLALSARLLLLVALGIAMSGVYRVDTADDLAVIAVVDTSMSVRNFARFGNDELGNPVTIDGAARGFLARASARRGPDDRLGIIAFDGRATTIALASKSGVLDRAIETDPVEGTNLAAAIRRARAQMPPDANARIVVISDGRSTSGSLEQISGDIPIDVVPIEYQIDREVVVESVELPARSLPGSIVDVRVVVRSLGRAGGRIQLTHNGEPIDLSVGEPGASRHVELDPGMRVLVFPVELDRSRVHRFEARFVPDELAPAAGGAAVYAGDTSLGNNAAGGVTLSSGDGRVLVVSENDEQGVSPAAALIDTLSRASWDIETVSPSRFPAGLLDLEAYDLIVLVNTPRDALALEADSLISAYVKDMGGGVIFVGGREALGAGGWKGSAIEGILPLRLDVADDLVTPRVAVVLVLDSSGSMRRTVMGSSRSQQAIANDAAAGAIEILDKNDLIGIVSFSDTARRVVDLSRNDQPETTRARASSISSGGGTNMGPGLRMAQRMLESADAQMKHIVLLSDGESQNPEMLPEIARELGEHGIKVSTIAVGDDADEQGMREIARISGGVYYRVLNPSVLPRIFLKAIRVVRTPLVREGRITPVILTDDTPATGPLGDLPDLGGLVMTERIGDDPRISTPIVSPENEPIFAFHQIELGRVSVFTSDVSSWGRRWVGTDAFASLWTHAASWTMRTNEHEAGELSLVVDSSRARIEYDAIDAQGAPIDGLDVHAQVFDASGRPRDVDLVQTGSGRYAGAIDGLAPGVHVVIASASEGGVPISPTIAGVQISGGDEFRHLSADRQSLIALARRTGGRVLDLGDPDSANLFDRTGLVSRESLEPVWTTLLVIALALFVLDLAMRRVAFDRWIAQARDETVAVTRSAGAEQMEGLFKARKQARAETVPAPEIDRSPMRVQPPDPEPVGDPEVSGADPDNPLMAAKRRAREQFDEQS